MMNNNSLFHLDKSILQNNLNDQVSYTDFFRAFGYTEKDRIFFRTFKDRNKTEEDTGKNLDIPFSRLDSILPELHRQNKEDRGIFFVVNGGGQKKAAVKIARAQFIDFDDYSFDEQIDRINAFSLEPSIIVKTKKSLHCYWLLLEGSVNGFTELQKRMIQYFGSDPSIKDESRVMRLYGFEHRKTESPVMVTLIKYDPDLQYTQRQLHEVLPVLDEKPVRKEKAQRPEEGELIPHGKRHKYIVSRIGEILDRLGDSADDKSILALIETDFLNHCEQIETDDMNDFRKKYLQTIKKIRADHEAEEKDPDFYKYAMRAWKEEHPGETFDLEKNSWAEVRAAGERAKEAGKVFDQKKISTVKDGKIVPVEDQKKKQVPKLKYISAAELGRAVLPEIFYPIEGLIAEGENVLAAPPKSGKSWMVLDMGLSVSRGLPFLGFKTNKCDVVYFAMEDGDKFEQERLNKLCNAEDLPENFHYVFEGVVPLDEGFIDQLEDTREAYPDLRLVIIDTLRFVASKQRKNESAYNCDYRTGQMLKAWGDKYGIAVLVVTHTTKLVNPSDALANVTGTNGVTGAADAVIVIAKEKRTAIDAVLAVDGRRVRQAEHDVKMNWDRCKWEYVGVSDADNRDQRQRQREIENLRASSTYKAVLKLSDQYIDGWKGTARNLVDVAADYGIFVIESVKEVGGILANNKALFAQDGVRVETIHNGTGANRYKISSWEIKNK